MALAEEYDPLAQTSLKCSILGTKGYKSSSKATALMLNNNLLHYLGWFCWQAIHIFGHTLIFTKANIPYVLYNYWCELEIIFHFGSVILISKSIGSDFLDFKSCFGALLSTISVYYYDKHCSASYQNVLIDCPNSQLFPHPVVWTTAIFFVLGNCIQRSFNLKNMCLRIFLMLFLIFQETTFEQDRRAMIFIVYRLMFAGFIFMQVPQETKILKKTEWFLGYSSRERYFSGVVPMAHYTRPSELVDRRLK